MRQEQKDSAIAATVTFVTTLLLLLMLFFCGLTYSRREMANRHTPELMMPEEEELFLEPEIIRDLGEEKAETKDAPSMENRTRLRKRTSGSTCRARTRNLRLP